MLKRKVVLAVALPVVIGVFVGLALPQPRLQGARGSLTALDYAEIQQLYSRYAIGVDSGNADMFANVFTADGTFELPGGKTIQGRKNVELAVSK